MPGGRGTLSRPVVLVVDDELRVLELFQKVLREEGYEVLTAEDGLRALAVAAEARPDLIVLDVVMPGLDGVATLRALRERGIPCDVVMVTAQGSLKTARQAMVLGAHDYITKPFDLELLKWVLRSRLEGVASERSAACAI